MEAEANYDTQKPERSEALRLACVNDHLHRSGIHARAEVLIDSFAGLRKGEVGLTWALPQRLAASVDHHPDAGSG